LIIYKFTTNEKATVFVVYKRDQPQLIIKLYNTMFQYAVMHS
jgi:hypothetical protein